MRIISDFHDYYDSLSYADPERDIVWLRKNDTFSLSEIPKAIRRPKTPFLGVVGFCGRFYPYWQPENTYVFGSPTKAEYEEKMSWANQGWYPGWYTGLRNWYDQITQKVDIELFVKLGSPIIHYTHGYAEINPRLENLLFFKVFDIYATYQTLQQFYHTHFIMPEPDTINIADRDMAAAKGFGHKYAFRKEPKKNDNHT